MNDKPPIPNLRAIFLLTFALSWALWIPAALTGRPITELPTAPLYFLGGFGPSVAALILLRRTSPEYRTAFWRRITNFRGIPARVYAVLLLVYPATTVLAYGLDGLLGGGPYRFPNAEANFASGGTVFAMLVITLVAGPLSEELGWRGMALPEMLRAGAPRRFRPITAALLLGIIWWAWHLPLFFIRGTSHNAWGLFSTNSAMFLLHVIPLSLLMTWAHLRSSAGALAAIILHFMFNLIFSLIFPVPLRVEIIRVSLALVFVVVLWGMGRGGED
jgi:membrane protease YdiL (CAAX protease family)